MIANDLARARALLGTCTLVVVRVGQVQGSVPRETGAWMVVSTDHVIGTIGGGRLEWDAIAYARHFMAGVRQLTGAANTPLSDASLTDSKHFKLGPSLGQCCGGALDILFETIPATLTPERQAQWLQALDVPRQPIALFGGGHVGHALEMAMRALPFDLFWVDSRDGIFPDDLPPHVLAEHSSPVHDAVADIKPGAWVLIMSFSHAEDLDVLLACLARQRAHGDLPFIGLIGSATKWASFSSRARARGFTPSELDHITCPIGLPGIAGKEPAVIAASVVAQLLGLRAA